MKNVNLLQRSAFKILFNDQEMNILQYTAVLVSLPGIGGSETSTPFLNNAGYLPSNKIEYET